MLKIERILVPFDFSEASEAALAPAAKVAKIFGASLHLFHAIVLHDFRPLEGDQGFPDLTEIEDAMAERAIELFDGLVTKLSDSDILVEKVERRGTAAAPLILEYAAQEEIDLIVMSTHGRRGLRRFLLGSVAEEVVQHGRCPVLTVQPSQDLRSVGEEALVLAPIDFSERSRQAAQEAADLARKLGAELKLVHVVLRPTHPASYDAFIELAPDSEQLAEMARPQLDEIAASLRTEGLEVEADVAIGTPADTIVAVAKSSGADLIVMASQGLTGLAHLLLGSVSERVVRQAPCPVLTLKDSGE